MSRAELQELWQSRIADFRASGLSAPVWCADHTINLHTLRYWLRKSNPRNSSERAAAVRWLSVEMDGDARPPSSNGLVVRVGDASVEVDPGCDLLLLREVVQALATLC